MHDWTSAEHWWMRDMVTGSWCCTFNGCTAQLSMQDIAAALKLEHYDVMWLKLCTTGLNGRRILNPGETEHAMWMIEHSPR